MSAATPLLLLMLSAGALLSSAEEEIECFECSSVKIQRQPGALEHLIPELHVTEDCLDPFDANANVPKCKGQQCQKAKGHHGGVLAVTRICIAETSAENGCESNDETDTCYCDTDLCNSSVQWSAGHAGVTALTAVSLIVLTIARLR